MRLEGRGDADASPSLGLLLLPPAPCSSWDARADPVMPAGVSLL